jgi:hypothetical protein
MAPAEQRNAAYSLTPLPTRFLKEAEKGDECGMRDSEVNESQRLLAQKRRMLLERGEKLQSVSNFLVYTLDEVCEIFFPNKGVTPKTLKKLHREGKLDIICMGRKKFVTHDAILNMMERCQERKVPHDSGLKKDPAGKPFGISSTADEKSAQAALNQELRKLKECSKPISPKSGKRPESVKRRES